MPFYFNGFKTSSRQSAIEWTLLHLLNCQSPRCNIGAGWQGLSIPGVERGEASRIVATTGMHPLLVRRVDGVMNGALRFGDYGILLERVCVQWK